MKDEKEISIVWFRRDLRLEDHSALYAAKLMNLPVICLFIFDEDIINELPPNDARVNFIYDNLQEMNQKLVQHQSTFLVKKGKPLAVWEELLSIYSIKYVFAAEDYEPYAIQRDNAVQILLQSKEISFSAVKDQVIFHKDEVVKGDGKPYTVFTPFKNKWLQHFEEDMAKEQSASGIQYYSISTSFPSRADLGIERSKIQMQPYQLENLDHYDQERDFPAKDAGSYLSPHLRFGTVSIRQLVKKALDTNAVFLSELIWREFFMQILWHFPRVVNESFRPAYDQIPWRNNEKEFELWCKGETGYPMVDAGMRQLNKTGYMHNRVRMVTASFLCKHLLIDWRWGEAYFAKKLLDYDLSANNGNWQWAAGTGCDAAPYFRVFNPSEQIKKFDPELKYIRKWVKDLDELTYPQPMVDHRMARERAIATYKEALQNKA